MCVLFFRGEYFSSRLMESKKKEGEVKWSAHLPQLILRLIRGNNVLREQFFNQISVPTVLIGCLFYKTTADVRYQAVLSMMMRKWKIMLVCCWVFLLWLFTMSYPTKYAIVGECRCIWRSYERDFTGCGIASCKRISNFNLLGKGRIRRCSESEYAILFRI